MRSDTDPGQRDYGRRDFLRISLLAAAGLALSPLQPIIELAELKAPSTSPAAATTRSQSIKGIYVPGWNAVGGPGVARLGRLIDETGINALMVDVKDAWGKLFYAPDCDLAKSIDAQVRTQDGTHRTLALEPLRRLAKEKGVRLLARHTMFWDTQLYDKMPALRLVRHNQERWVDMRKQEVIDYNLELIAQESGMGFDEIVLDYIRFPAAPGMPPELERCARIDTVVATVRERGVPAGVRLGVQVFGYTAWHHTKAGVGQRIETLALHADSIYPMLYPSHFWKGSFGFADPSKHPYEFIRMGYEEAATKVGSTTRIIPMVQAFWYTPKDIASQLRAVDEASMPGFVAWNPSGSYGTLAQAMALRGGAAR